MVNKIDLLSDSEFIELINDSSCISDVLKKLGYSTNGNSWGNKIIKEIKHRLYARQGFYLPCGGLRFLRTLPRCAVHIFGVAHNYKLRAKLFCLLRYFGIKARRDVFFYNAVWGGYVFAAVANGYTGSRVAQIDRHNYHAFILLYILGKIII